MPKVLVTNDDGIDSFFLKALVEALKKDFTVSVAAPLGERSWIGRAITRVGEVHVSEYEHLGCQAWTLDGSPSDCVNIAMGHLLSANDKPDIVVSGINLGYNSAMPFILSSGTIAGALEGAFWGLPALAFSLTIAPENFETLRKNHGTVSGDAAASLNCAASRSAQMTLDALGESQTGMQVYNVNFPESTTMDTPVKNTVPGHYRLGSLFRKTGDATYEFDGSNWSQVRLNNDTDTDDSCLRENKAISVSKLDFSVLGR